MIETDRLVAPDGKQNEDALDRAIRPRVLADYVGQPVVCEQMEIFVAAARGRREQAHGPATMLQSRLFFATRAASLRA